MNITIDRAVLEQALEALNHGITEMNHRGCAIECMSLHHATKAIREELAQPQPVQDPLAEGKQFQAKFNIGDRAWFMKNNIPTEVVISAIEVFYVNTNQDRITYNAENAAHPICWLDHTKLQEAWLFNSKTELLASL